MDQGKVLEIFQSALIVAFKIAGPMLIVSILIGLIIAIFQAATQIPTYCIGGKLDTDNQSFVGSMAEEMVSRFNIDIMFFSTSGINEKSMIVDYCEGANDLRRRALPYAHKKVFLCDSSKFNRRAAYSLCALSDVDTILVDAPLPDNMDTGNAEVIVIE